MSGAPLVVAVIAGHGDFAHGMRSAVEQITGRGDAFVTVTNRGKSPPELEAELDAQLDGTGARVIFTDLPAGSCTIAARRVQRRRPDVVVVTGANLAVLMEYLFAAISPLGAPVEAVGRPAELARTAAEKARATLGVSEG